MKKNLPDDWKAQVLDRIDKKTGFIDANGKRHYSPMYTWVKELFATPANDEKWVQLSERLPVNVLADALEVCRRALFNIPPRVFPWDNSAAVAKARKNAKELVRSSSSTVVFGMVTFVSETTCQKLGLNSGGKRSNGTGKGTRKLAGCLQNWVGIAWWFGNVNFAEPKYLRKS